MNLLKHSAHTTVRKVLDFHIIFFSRTKHRVLTFFDGTSEEFPGVCHIPMEPAFCEDTRKLLINVAKELKLKVHESGTAICIEGPRFSTKAESNLFRTWGASLVNMTLVPEVST